MINTHTDPQLARGLLAGELNFARCPKTGDELLVSVPVIFHDPLEKLFVLVLPETARHLELHARSELYAELAEMTDYPVPPYVRKLDAVFGPNGLRGLLAARETERDGRRGRDDLEVLRSKLGARERELKGRASELKSFEEELGRLEAELEQREEQLAAAEADLATRQAAAEAAAAAAAAGIDDGDDDDGEGLTAERMKPKARLPAPFSSPADTSPSLAPPPADISGLARRRAETDTDPRAPGDGHTEGSSTTPFDRIEPSEELEQIEPEEIVDDEVVVADQLVEGELPNYADPGVEGATRVGGQLDVLIERWIASREPTLAAVDEQGRVRVALATAAETLEGCCRTTSRSCSSCTGCRPIRSSPSASEPATASPAGGRCRPRCFLTSTTRATERCSPSSPVTSPSRSICLTPSTSRCASGEAHRAIGVEVAGRRRLLLLREDRLQDPDHDDHDPDDACVRENHSIVRSSRSLASISSGLLPPDAPVAMSRSKRFVRPLSTSLNTQAMRPFAS